MIINNNNATTEDLIHHYWGDIETAFQQVGGIAPHPNALQVDAQWHYCRTTSRKDKGKIGYRAVSGVSGASSTPFLTITVNSFKHGGESAFFTTRGRKDHLPQNNDPAPTKKRYLRLEELTPVTVTRRNSAHQAQAAAREAEKRAKRQAKYRFYCQAWEHAGEDPSNKAAVTQHSYVVAKGITYQTPLRHLPNRSLAYPLY